MAIGQNFQIYDSKETIYEENIESISVRNQHKPKIPLKEDAPPIQKMPKNENDNIKHTDKTKIHPSNTINKKENDDDDDVQCISNFCVFCIYCGRCWINIVKLCCDCLVCIADCCNEKSKT